MLPGDKRLVDGKSRRQLAGLDFVKPAAPKRRLAELGVRAPRAKGDTVRAHGLVSIRARPHLAIRRRPPLLVR